MRVVVVVTWTMQMAAAFGVPPCKTKIPAEAPWIDCELDATTYGPLPATGAYFATTDAGAQHLYDKAETCASGNKLLMGPGFDVMTEGGGYSAVWLETQPMAGGMYAARNLTIAVNNQLIFMRTQRQDGRLPGMVTTHYEGNPAPLGTVHPTYSYPHQANRSMLQGFYMATPAVDTAWFLNVSGSAVTADQFLTELTDVLIRFDTWIWNSRNSSHGVLWLNDTADTGEDGSDRLQPIPNNRVSPPFESMDMQGYAHDCQRALARIAAIKGDAKAEAHWKSRMESTAAALRRRLWRDDRGACFDRERDNNRPRLSSEPFSDGQFVDALVHNNLRAMWHGIFSQQMADTFVAQHLMNQSEFWTPTPLPSIAASDPRFRDPNGSNNWSGPPEGLTFQRTLRALEGYGHHAELLLIGARQRASLLKAMRFTQQIDPFTSIPNSHGDCYGPMLLSSLEYTARSTGISVRPEMNEVLWTAADARVNFNFTQTIGSSVYELEGRKGGFFRGYLSGKLVFMGRGEARVVTNPAGGAVRIVGVLPTPASVTLTLPDLQKPVQINIGPNEEWTVKNDAAILVRRTPFRLPFD